MPGALDKVDEMILASFKANVLPRLGPGASTEGAILRRILRWSSEGVHMAPDSTPSSQATGRGQRDVLELRRLLCTSDQFATKELAQEMQTPSMLSMLKLRRFVRCLLGAADLRVPGLAKHGDGLD